MNALRFKVFSLFFLLLGSCHGQNPSNKAMNTSNNPLLCDPAEGICATPHNDESAPASLDSSGTNAIKILYFTDPICSSCWGIEPQLRKLKLEYGHSVEIEYHMGGLLPDWSYNSGGISKPSDVAHHWDEVSAYYKMPIDGDVWLEDPLHSSYPPSIAFKAAQMQDEIKSIAFLRILREMVFLQKKNITKWEHLEYAAKETGLNVDQLKLDIENKAIQLFQADLDLAKKMKVRGFPTLIVTNSKGDSEIIYGFKPYDAFVQALKKIYEPLEKIPYDPNGMALFAIYPTLTTRELVELSGNDWRKTEQELSHWESAGKITQLRTKNGSLWQLKR